MKKPQTTVSTGKTTSRQTKVLESKAPVGQGLPRAAKIRKRPQFERIQRHGQKLHAKHFIILIEKGEGRTRLGITISTKVSPKATLRNLVKRRVRDIFRKNQHRFIEPVDLVVLARSGSTDCSYDDMARQLLGALKHHGFIK